MKIIIAAVSLLAFTVFAQPEQEKKVEERKIEEKTPDEAKQAIDAWVVRMHENAGRLAKMFKKEGGEVGPIRLALRLSSTESGMIYFAVEGVESLGNKTSKSLGFISFVKFEYDSAGKKCHVNFQMSIPGEVVGYELVGDKFVLRQPDMRYLEFMTEAPASTYFHKSLANINKSKK